MSGLDVIQSGPLAWFQYLVGQPFSGIILNEGGLSLAVMSMARVPMSWLALNVCHASILLPVRAWVLCHWSQLKRK